MTERELQTAVIECARLLGWYVAHFRPARTAHGWRTPVEADGAGFPDLVLVRGRVVYAELKRTGGYTQPAQQRWIQALRDAGAEVHIWKPIDWTSGRVEEVLRAT